MDSSNIAMTARGTFESYSLLKEHRHADVDFKCSRCGGTFPAQLPGSMFGNYGVGGYGDQNDDLIFCLPCCGDMDREHMQAKGRATLYLTQPKGERWTVTNFPGTLRYEVYYHRTGAHNIAGRRYDVWFTDDQGNKWWGVQYGDWTQIVHCKRVKND